MGDHKQRQGISPERVADSSEPASSKRPAVWWQDAVMYQVYLRSFVDTTGDGVGDLPGVRSRLEYIRGLGVDGIWINPFYRSPQEDGGYDVADYFDVDPVFGDIEDFDGLLNEAHAMGMRVLVDLVPNHTSSAHEWFQAALYARPGSRERDRYIFRPGSGPTGVVPPNNWRSVFGGPAWSRVSDVVQTTGGARSDVGELPAEAAVELADTLTTRPDSADSDWYLHLFAPGQPDLNWQSDEVTEYFDEVLRFWLERGVDGFRIDVAHGMLKHPDLPDLDEPPVLANDDHPYWDRDAVHDIYRRWRKVLDSYPGERVFLAEAWVKSPARLARYLRPDELHMAFNFDFLKCDWDADAFRETISSTLANLAEVMAIPTWVLSNHDVVRHPTRYGGGEVGVERARAALLLMLALPGAVFLYQGEELGLPEVLDLPDEVLQDPTFIRTGGKVRGRDGCRVPLPWDVNGPSFGFSTGEAWLPQPSSWAKLSVEAENADEKSTLNLYRRAIGERAKLGALRSDIGLEWLDGPPGVVAFTRGGRFCCVVNCSDDPQEIPPEAIAVGPVVIASFELDRGAAPGDAVPCEAAGGEAAKMAIPGNAALWFAAPSGSAP